ncbi:MAG: hypothetical protein HYU28_12250 [Actinobacteria bacterium]|nr:hypothetical protein [Actinomycetota bacterium]
MGTPGVASHAVQASPRAVGPPDVEVGIARSIARHGLVAAPAFVLAALVWRGLDGAWSAGLGLALVVANVVAAARLARWAARISPGALYAATLGGYVARLAVITGFVLLVRHWVDVVALGISIVVAQLTLLAWEVRSVSQSPPVPAP